jgi:hypothetical protein
MKGTALAAENSAFAFPERPDNDLSLMHRCGTLHDSSYSVRGPLLKFVSLPRKGSEPMTADVNGASNYEYCDLVMNGGITSGVIYPKAAAKLATRYRFMNIGGTTAGAIAAAVTAAAEFGRRSGTASAFDVLDKLPADLASNGHLLKLFTPDIGTSTIFGIAVGLLAGNSCPDRIWKIAKGAALASPLFFLCTLLGVAILPTFAFSLVRPYGIQCVPGLFLRHYLVCSIAGLLPGLIVALLVAVLLGGRKARRLHVQQSPP